MLKATNVGVRSLEGGRTRSRIRNDTCLWQVFPKGCTERLGSKNGKLQASNMVNKSALWS